MAKRPNEVIVESITEALFLLMKDQDFSRITITDITKKAGVGRVSFYRNFDSKEDVIQKYLDRLTLEFKNDLHIDQIRDNHRLYVSAIFNHLGQHKELITMLDAAGLLHIIKQEFDRAFLTLKSARLPESVCYMTAGAYYNLLYYWMNNGFKETPDELSQLKFSL